MIPIPVALVQGFGLRRRSLPLPVTRVSTELPERSLRLIQPSWLGLGQHADESPQVGAQDESSVRNKRRAGCSL